MKKMLLLLISISYIVANNLCTLLPNEINEYKQSAKCEYATINSNQGKSSQAYKEYKKNDKKFMLQLMQGNQANQMMSSFMMPMQIETADMVMKTTYCKKFKCAITYDKKEKSGVIIVLLNQNGPIFLILTCKKMDINEVLNIINKIDIQKIKNSL